MHLDATNARRYRKPAPVKAFHAANGATYHMSFGDIHYEGAHWVIVGGDAVYGVAEDAFDATYEPVSGQPDVYLKTGLIWARRMDEPFAVVSAEGPEQGEAGDWLAQGLDGGQWLIPGEVFAATYEPAEESSSA